VQQKRLSLTHRTAVNGLASLTARLDGASEAAGDRSIDSPASDELPEARVSSSASDLLPAQSAVCEYLQLLSFVRTAGWERRSSPRSVAFAPAPSYKNGTKSASLPTRFVARSGARNRGAARRIRTAPASRLADVSAGSHKLSQCRNPGEWYQADIDIHKLENNNIYTYIYICT
jgi:hypothetical protein